MKKKIISGVLAAVLIAGGGNGLYMTEASAKGNTETAMQHEKLRPWERNNSKPF